MADRILWRTRVRAGDWTYMWRSGDPKGPARITPPEALVPVGGGAALPVKPFLLGRTAREHWDAVYSHHGVRVPADAAPGRYALTTAQGKTGVEIDVRPPRPPRPEVTLPAGSDAAAIETALSTHDVLLAPGEHVVRRAVQLAPGSRLRGVGAVVRRVADGAYQNYVFGVAPDATLGGLTITGDFVSLMFSPAEKPCDGVTVRDCTVRGGTIGEWVGGDRLVEDCTFERSSLNQAPAGTLVHRCRFEGVAEAAHAFTCWGATSLAVVGCDFIETDRGLCFNTFRGPIQGCLFVDNVFRHLVRGNAGSEVINVENGVVNPFRDNLFLHTQVLQCKGPAVLFWNARCEANTFLDMRIDGGMGVILTAFDKLPQRGNRFELVELAGTAGVLLYEWATDNEFVHCAFLGYAPVMGNVVGWRPERYARRGVVEALGPRAFTNRVTECAFAGLPAGVVPVRGAANDKPTLLG